MADKEEVQDTSDYKLSNSGRKVKAHRIVFNKGEDDGKKGISEMKKSYKNFVEQHTAELTEEQKNEIVTELQEVLGKSAEAGEWISDFVHSDNPKFAGKSKEKRKQMALAAYYAKQRNEEVVAEAGNKPLEKSRFGTGDTRTPRDIKSQMQGASDEFVRSTADKKTGPFHSKVAKMQGKMAKSELRRREQGVAEELKGNQHKLDKNKNGKLDKHDFKLLRKEENMEESVFDWKNKARQTSDSGKTKTYHDVKKTSTGTVYTKQFDKDGMSKGTGDDAAKKAEGTPKRGRGRPKKDKFAEAVEFLLALSEEHFDDMMEEGFDAFIESYEQLDELSKATLGSYAKKAAQSAMGHSLDVGDLGRQQSSPERTTKVGASIDKMLKRKSGHDKAVDRLTK